MTATRYPALALCAALAACASQPADPSDNGGSEEVILTVGNNLDASRASAGDGQTALAACDLNGVTYRCATISYGSHALQDYELWLPNASHPRGEAPLVVYVHGGGYFQGDKQSAYTLTAMADFLQAGYAFATINYRLSGEFPFEKGVTGEYPAAMRDGATALQDLRCRARQLGYSPEKVALTGSSAGGGISLWVALHDDLRDRSSPRARDRQSTKVPCVALSDTQTTLNIAEVASLLGDDRFQLDEGLAGLYGFSPAEYDSDPEDYQRRYADSMYEASPISHLSADDDVKLLLTYSLGYDEGNIHSPEFGDYLAAGRPADLAAAYARRSLRDLAIEHVLKAGQKTFRNRRNVFNFIQSSCF